MKRLFITLTMMVVAFMANAQSCPDDNHPHAIDLGLPSGTKWACCNVGATTPEAYGDYFAWGETEEKEIYDWTTYTHCDGSEITCHDLGSDIAGSEYDVAHVRWGGSWVMPSQEQLQELVSNCSYTGTTKNGMEGGLLTGPSGGTIFLPGADIRWNAFIDCLVLGGYYWSSTQSPSSDYAFRLFFDLSWGGGCGIEERGHALTVRPVIGGTFRGGTNIVCPESSTDDNRQAIYNIYGRKVADTIADMKVLHPGIYIVNGKMIILK